MRTKIAPRSSILPASGKRVTSGSVSPYKLKQLMELASHDMMNVDDLEDAMPCPLSNSDWQRLVQKLRMAEADRVKRMHGFLDPKKCVFVGDAWKGDHEELAYTWPGADDGLQPPEEAIELLFIVNFDSFEIQPEPFLALAAHIQLGIPIHDSNSIGFASEEDKVRRQIRAWAKAANLHMEAMVPSRTLKRLWRRSEGGIKQFADLLERYHQEEAEHNSRRRDTRSHEFAQELQWRCSELIEAIDRPSKSDDDWLLLMRLFNHASQLHENLLRAATRGHRDRILRMLRQRGPRSQPFSVLVTRACDVLLQLNPGRRPWPKEVLDEMKAEVIQKGEGAFIRFRESVNSPFETVTIKAFHDARHRWAKDRGLRTAGTRRPPPGMTLPKVPKQTRTRSAP